MAEELQAVIDEHKEQLGSGLYKQLCDISMSLHKSNSEVLPIYPTQLIICYPRKTITYGIDDEPVLVLHTAVAVFQIELPTRCDDSCERCSSDGENTDHRCSWAVHVLGRSGLPLRVYTQSLLHRLARLRSPAAIAFSSLLDSLFELEDISLATMDETVESECGTVVVISLLPPTRPNGPI